MANKIGSAKGLDNWLGVVRYRAIQSAVKGGPTGPDASAYGGHLRAILLPELNQRLSPHEVDLRHLVEQLQGRLSRAAWGMSANELRDWALFFIETINLEPLLETGHALAFLDPDDPFRQALDEMDFSEAATLLRGVLSHWVKAVQPSAWERLLRSLRDLSESSLPLGSVIDLLPMANVCGIISRDEMVAAREAAQMDLKEAARVVTDPNEAVVEFREARQGWGGSLENALRLLWNSGVTAGAGPSKWDDAIHGDNVEDVYDLDAGAQDAAVRLIEGVDDYTSRQSLLDMLEHGADESLVPRLKAATYHDLMDEKRREGVLKRKADKEAVPLGEREIAVGEDYAGLQTWDIERLAGQLPLSRREKEAVLLRLASLADGGDPLTFAALGDRMGVDKGTARKHLRRGVAKLRPYLEEH